MDRESDHTPGEERVLLFGYFINVGMTTAELMVVSEDMNGDRINSLCGRKCEVDSELDIKEDTRWVQLARDVVQRRDIVDTG